jgi:hypothetical protein
MPRTSPRCLVLLTLTSALIAAPALAAAPRPNTAPAAQPEPARSDKYHWPKVEWPKFDASWSRGKSAADERQRHLKRECSQPMIGNICPDKIN